LLEAVLYDLDGLMVDTEPLHQRASELALERYGRKYEEIPETLRKSVYGKRATDVASILIGGLGLPVSAGQWAEERNTIFLGLIEKGLDLMPGLAYSIGFFEKRGLRRAVVSSGDSRYIQRILELTGLRDRFEAVITGDDVTLGKPDPQCYLLGACNLDVNPECCLVLEDALAGVAAARAAGMKVIGVANRFNNRFDGADVVLESLAGIDDCLIARLETSCA
jgi:beta-phosphoglucomutase